MRPWRWICRVPIPTPGWPEYADLVVAAAAAVLERCARGASPWAASLPRWPLSDCRCAELVLVNAMISRARRAGGASGGSPPGSRRGQRKRRLGAVATATSTWRRTSCTTSTPPDLDEPQRRERCGVQLAVRVHVLAVEYDPVLAGADDRALPRRFPGTSRHVNGSGSRPTSAPAVISSPWPSRPSSPTTCSARPPSLRQRGPAPRPPGTRSSSIRGLASLHCARHRSLSAEPRLHGYAVDCVTCVAWVSPFPLPEPADTRAASCCACCSATRKSSSGRLSRAHPPADRSPTSTRICFRCSGRTFDAPTTAFAGSIADVVFLALPHGASANVAAALARSPPA